MTEPSDIAGLIAAGGASGIGLWKLGEWFVTSKLKRGEALEERHESQLEQKVDLLLSKVTSIESENRVTAERQLTAAAVVAEVKGRIDGISENHGKRLATVELEHAKQGERLAAVEGVLRRAKR